MVYNGLLVVRQVCVANFFPWSMFTINEENKIIIFIESN